MHVADRVRERIIRHLVRISIEWHGHSRIQETERSCVNNISSDDDIRFISIKSSRLTKKWNKKLPLQTSQARSEGWCEAS